MSEDKLYFVIEEMDEDTATVFTSYEAMKGWLEEAAWEGSNVDRYEVYVIEKKKVRRPVSNVSVEISR